MWLLRRDLKLVHEYQADQAVLNKGIDAKKYQLLVLEKSVGERRFAMANHFTQKPILKRIKMMKKKNKKQWNWVKIILFIPALILLLQAFSRPELITTPDNFIPAAVQEDLNAKWLERWTFENMGDGFFQPGLKDVDAPQKPNNVLVILMNRKNELLIENQFGKKEDLKGIVKIFLTRKNPDGKKQPDYIETEIPLIGKVKVAQGLISFRNDLDTSMDEMNRVLKSIGEAYLEVRKEKAQVLFGEDYFSLSEQKQEAINMAVPIWFSIESPKSTRNPPPPPPPKFVLKLYNDKVTIWDKEIAMNEVSVKAKEFVNKAGKNAIVRVDAESGISEERIGLLKEELRKAGALNVNFRTLK